MAQAARKIEPEAPALSPEQQAIIFEVSEQPSVVLLDKVKFDAFVDAVRAEATLEPGDLSTQKGRDRIKANAAEVARKKAGINRERLRLTEKWRVQTAAVNAAGKMIDTTLDQIRDEVRAPLTEWEQGEAARKAEADAIIGDMQTASIIGVDATIDDLRDRLDRIRGRNLSDELFGPRIEMVTDLRDSTVATLQAGIERLEAAARERAELERLRQEAADRIEADRRREAEAEAARQADETRRREEAEAEQRREDAAAQAERDRQEAADRARQEAEDKARREQEERDAEFQRQREEEARRAQAEIDAANARAAEAERAAAEERDRLAREEADRVEAARQEREAREARERDQAHRGAVKDTAREAIIRLGVSARLADKVVQAIVAGDVPAVSIAF